MKKIVTIMLVLAMSITTLLGCSNNTITEELPSIKDEIASQVTVETVQPPSTQVQEEVVEEAGEEMTVEEAEEVLGIDFVTAEDIQAMVEEAKAKFNMDDLVADEQIDLRAEHTVDLGEFAKLNITDKDLEFVVYNRLITLTGTTAGAFFDTFEGNEWIDVTRMNLDNNLHPWNSIRYHFAFPDGLDNGISISIVNTTDEVKPIKDCPIYSIKVDYIKDPVEIATYRISEKEHMGTEAGYFVDMFNDTQYNYFFMRVMPTQNRAIEHAKEVYNFGAVSDVESDYSLGSNTIQLLGKTVDFNLATLADYVTGFEVRQNLELPEFVSTVFYCDGDYLNDEMYKVYGSGFCVIEAWESENMKHDYNARGYLEAPDAIYVNTMWTTLNTSETDLWNLPVDNVYTNFSSEYPYDVTMFNIGGFTNNLTHDEVLAWYDSLEGNLNNVRSKLENMEGKVEIYHPGVKDVEFLNLRPEATGYHYSYGITEFTRPGEDYHLGYNVEIRKNDLNPYIPEGERIN